MGKGNKNQCRWSMWNLGKGWLPEGGVWGYDNAFYSIIRFLPAIKNYRFSAIPYILWSNTQLLGYFHSSIHSLQNEATLFSESTQSIQIYFKWVEPEWSSWGVKTISWSTALPSSKHNATQATSVLKSFASSTSQRRISQRWIARSSRKTQSRMKYSMAWPLTMSKSSRSRSNCSRRTRLSQRKKRARIALSTKMLRSLPRSMKYRSRTSRQRLSLTSKRSRISAAETSSIVFSKTTASDKPCKPADAPLTPFKNRANSRR